jgi:hypothetical protein
MTGKSLQVSARLTVFFKDANLESFFAENIPAQKTAKS